VSTGVRLHWRSWEDEFVVYSSGSGNTHLLNTVAAKVLQILEREPTNLSELVEKVAATLEIEPSSELFAHLEKSLSDFCRLGLIEQT
jgi:PqqD family protein of HPr-rel-A system